MRAASLFCGAGGTCLGLRAAGYDVVAGVDFDPDALATYAAAGGHPVQHMITEGEPVPPAWVERLTDLDLLWASPPCQPWSRAGRGLGAEDDRDAWPATVAAVRLLRPRWFAAENVRGVESHLDGYVAPALRALGYVVGWRVLNAADYGVPQSRRRVILVAGPRDMCWTPPSHGDPATLAAMFERRRPWRTMGEALGIDGASSILDRPAPCVCASEAKGHTNPDRGRGRASPINRASDALYLATGRRRLTVEECATLQGFPPDYRWRGGITARYRQVGNAVPPALAEAVARGIACS